MTEPPSIRFTCTFGGGESAGHIPIGFDQRALFGRARPPVTVAINRHVYRSTIAIMGGETFVPLRRSHREAAGVQPGDMIEVTLTLDDAPRTVEVPADLLAALGAAGATAGWQALSFSHRREWVEAVATAKKPETRAKRIAAAVGKAKERLKP